MVKRKDGKRKPLKRKKIAFGKSIDGIKRRRSPEPKRKYNNINHIDIDYIETDQHMEEIFQFSLAVAVAGLAIIFLCVAGICGVATFYGIKAVIDTRREKRTKKRGKK